MRLSGKCYKDLVFHQWWTNASGKTDPAGSFRTRGFLGDYEIRATCHGKTQTIKVSLKKDQPNLVELRAN
jgi:hypothetical protein